MKNLYCLLDNHSDHKINTVLSDNLSWISAHFDTLLTESVPVAFSGENVLRYLFTQIKDHIIKGLNDSGFSQEEQDFLGKGWLPEQMKPSEFISKRIQLISQVIDKYPEFQHLLCLCKRQMFLDQCHKKGIRLQGLEHKQYIPGNGIFEPIVRRDDAFYQNTLQAIDASKKGVFVIIGPIRG